MKLITTVTSVLGLLTSTCHASFTRVTPDSCYEVRLRGPTAEAEMELKERDAMKLEHAMIEAEARGAPLPEWVITAQQDLNKAHLEAFKKR